GTRSTPIAEPESTAMPMARRLLWLERRLRRARRMAAYAARFRPSERRGNTCFARRRARTAIGSRMGPATLGGQHGFSRARKEAEVAAGDPGLLHFSGSARKGAVRGQGQEPACAREELLPGGGQRHARLHSAAQAP